MERERLLIDTSILIDHLRKSHKDKTIFYRRSRGYVPETIKTTTSDHVILALGGELKNTLCLRGKDESVVSHHIGDLENLKTYESFTQAIEHMQKIFQKKADCYVCDLHPNYLATQWAEKNSSSIRLIKTQHHHAHAAGVYEEHKLQGPAIGIILDGTGLGTDQTLWGGEVLLFDKVHFERLHHLEPFPLPGGEKAIKEVWRQGLALVSLHYSEQEIYDLPLPFLEEKLMSSVLKILKNKNILTSGAGRLFDAVSSILGICQKASYEGQAAILLEQCAASSTTKEEYPFPVQKQILTGPFLYEMIQDQKAGIAISDIAMKFHNGLVRSFVSCARKACATYNTKNIVLSGGCFLNELLLDKFMLALKDAGLNVYPGETFGPGDGSLSFGQAAIASAILKGETSCVLPSR